MSFPEDRSGDKLPLTPQSPTDQVPGQPPVKARKWHIWRRSKPPSAKVQSNAIVPYSQLFRYASRSDKLMILLSSAFAVAHGALMPILIITFGSVLDDFGNILRDPSDPQYVPQSQISGEITTTTNLVLILSFVAFFLSIAQLSLALVAANRIGNRLRHRFFDSLIRQDADFYDDSEAGTLTNLVVNDINLIQAGIGDKLATCVQYFATFIIGVVIGFVYGWKLALVISAVTPVIFLTGAIMGKQSAEATSEGLGSYGEAGGIASEVLSLIRTVTAFGGQDDEISAYNASVYRAYKAGAKAAIASGLGLGIAMMLILFTYALSFWAGARFVRDNSMSTGDVLLTFLSFAIGASTLGTAGPAFKSFGVARAAAPRVYEIIERVSPIDPLDDTSGIIPDGPVQGRITFEDVDFNYRKRITEDGQSALVLDKFNLEIPIGSSEAFVGKSGCGKSTIARLILRLYDPLKGRVLLDGVDLRDLNLRWLRSQVGIVPQNPALFMLSIRDNIALGAGVDITVEKGTGKKLARRRDVSTDEIILAAKIANAHGFITKLPEGYDTVLGERGAMLSGGQKQRICIARALLRNPKVLLLDESTASLDAASERLVQDALEKASSGRTTVTIAHRLSTVRHADSISCIEDGKIVERGRHDALMQRENGFYHTLFQLQSIERAKLEEEKADGLGEPHPDVPLRSVSRQAQQSMGKSVSESITKMVGLEHSDEEEEPAVDKGVFRRSLKMNMDEWHLLTLGPLGALVAGAILPLMSIPFIQVIHVMLTENTENAMRKWILGFVLLGVIAFFANFLQNAVLGICGEKLTMKLRQRAFKALLRQEIGYFDMKENSLGALTGLLSTDAGAVKGLTGDLFGIMISVVGSLGTGLVIAVVSCWRLMLVVLAIIPGVALGGYFEAQASAGIDSGARKDFAKANIIAAEAVDNVVTVRHLGVEDHFLKRFGDMIDRTVAVKRRKSLLTGVAFGFSEFSQFLIWYATYKAGGDFVAQGHCSFADMFRTTLALMFAAMTLGNITVFAPDVGASKLSATHIYRLLDRESQIDPSSSEGEVLESVQGGISGEHIYFEYPRRPDVPVLRGLSLHVEPGQVLAIVGTSGHGKSTIIALLERFYNFRAGRICLDERDISGLKVQGLRERFGYVPQEPELFNRSVFDNIVYGASHQDGTPITKEDVIAVARDANAHDFIEALPYGYETVVGPRGEAISGGQRQRVAIARSLLRKPPVLLLDEATSALDSASERLVQDALNRAASGRTTVLVAHRLSTIRNADIIAVIWRGRVAESGTHEELLRKNGAYAKLIENQLTET